MMVKKNIFTIFFIILIYKSRVCNDIIMRLNLIISERCRISLYKFENDNNN